MTDRQSEVLCWIIDHAKRHLRQPTYREVLRRFGWSSQSANYMSELVVAFIRQGFASHVEGPRGIVFTMTALAHYDANIERWLRRWRREAA